MIGISLEAAVYYHNFTVYEAPHSYFQVFLVSGKSKWSFARRSRCLVIRGDGAATKGRMPKARKLSAPVYRGPIPRVKGPKLNEFPNRRAAIHFRRLLSDPDSEGQSHVFEVRIGSKIYALKVFKFYDDDEDEAALWEHEKDFVSLDLLHAHADPFYNECRAYGRLEEAGLNGTVAVRCYGYTTLPAAIEAELEAEFDVTDWDRDDYDMPVEKREPFRAIIKDMVRKDRKLTHRVVKRMLKDLLQIRELGIYPSDIQRRNYKNGKLVDFSNAITEPNYLFEVKPDYQVEHFHKKVDLAQFDKLIRDENIKTWVKAIPDTRRKYLSTLRPRENLRKPVRWQQ